MQGRMRSMSLSLLLACGLSVLVNAVSAAPPDGNPNNRGALALPISSGFTLPPNEETLVQVSEFRGMFHLHSFEVRNQQLVAVGVLVGTVSNDNENGNITIAHAGVALPVTLPPTPITVCNFLRLNLGSRAVVLPNNATFQLGAIALEVSAEPEVGNPMANLLCTIVGQINAGGNLAPLAANLNQLIAILS